MSKATPRHPVHRPPANNTMPRPVDGPQFAEPAPSPDPSKFVVKHGSDKEAYSILDHERGSLKPRPFPVVHDTKEPVLTLAQTIGTTGDSVVTSIQQAGQIVFHALGDTGNTRGPKDQSLVADKMVADFDDADRKQVPSFMYHLGDVVYSFGEAEYYYDQFYEPYRDYPAPIMAIAGNHDGMVAPNTSTPTLAAFLENFCTSGEAFHRTPEAGGLDRTAQIQPGVYFTFDAPYVRILGLYSNCLEDPGIISSQGGTYPYLGTAQLEFLEAALGRIKDENYAGAVIIAMHHPPYVAQKEQGHAAGRHGGSPQMLAEIDAACEKSGVWPHAILSGHAHNYQRFTRYYDDRETPFLVAGNGGHAVTRLTHKASPTLRVPVDQPSLSNGRDHVTFESYDDQDFGYLRILANDQQLRIEYHPMADGEKAKTPDDFVTVSLADRKIEHFRAHPHKRST